MMCFFFSSRRRHTRLVSDWSSDVCSSDLRSMRPSPGAERPLPDRSRLLALRELEPLARTRLPVLLPLLHPGVAGQEPRPLELGPELVAELEKGPRDAVPHGAGLARETTTLDVRQDVELRG